MFAYTVPWWIQVMVGVAEANALVAPAALALVAVRRWSRRPNAVLLR